MKKNKLEILSIVIVGIIIILLLNIDFNSFKKDNNDNNNPANGTKNNNNVVENNKVKKSTVTISFVGDLILLENQVKAGYNGSEYNFDKMFEYTKSYFAEADYSIGVLEGPVASGSYSSGNFDDGKRLILNFPLQFAESIKNSGIDLVTISNNHILDKGVKAVSETIESLNNIGLDYTGDSNNNKIVDINGLKVGVLAYTYGSNHYSTDSIIDLNVTNVIVKESNKNFNKIKEKVINDFETLKKQNVDLIIVLPHMGTQFAHSTDSMQNTWNQIFAENGADIIFGDHSHAVQPVTYLGDTVIVNSPGNFANQYYKFDGDATAITEVTIDKNTKKIVSADVIPMYTRGDENGFYYSIPIYDIMTNKEIYDDFSTTELTRVKKVQSLITKVMLGEEVSLDSIEKRYYLYKDGYKSNLSDTLVIDKNLQNKVLYSKLKESDEVCFIGDSITAGSRNGGYSWYLPLMANFDATIKKVAYDSYTTKLLLANKSEEIKNCAGDLNIIAIGTNDIRYRDNTAALTSEDYINNIEKIVGLIKSENSKAQIVLIAPWYSMDNDSYALMSLQEKEELFSKYSKALNEFANKNNYLYINANKEIKQTINQSVSSYYMVDFIHPNKTRGIYLYSFAVLNASK